MSLAILQLQPRKLLPINGNVLSIASARFMYAASIGNLLATQKTNASWLGLSGIGVNVRADAPLPVLQIS